MSLACCAQQPHIGGRKGTGSLPEIAETASRSSKLRSAISNDPYRLPGVSMRGLLGRRFRDLVADIAAELGGVDRLSVIELALIRGAAMDVMRQEDMIGKMMLGQPIDHEELTRAGNSARSALTKLGIKRQHRNRTTVTLADIIAEHHEDSAA
jgi:hypothetical protein